MDLHHYFNVFWLLVPITAVVSYWMVRGPISSAFSYVLERKINLASPITKWMEKKNNPHHPFGLADGSVGFAFFGIAFIGLGLAGLQWYKWSYAPPITTGMLFVSIGWFILFMLRAVTRMGKAVTQLKEVSHEHRTDI